MLSQRNSDISSKETVKGTLKATDTVMDLYNNYKPGDFLSLGASNIGPSYGRAFVLQLETTKLRLLVWDDDTTTMGSIHGNASPSTFVKDLPYTKFMLS